MSFNVLLDTNVFMACKYDFEHGPLSSLKKYEEKGLVHLVSNDIIIREVKHHIMSDVGLWASQAKNSIKAHSELVNAISFDEFERIKSTLLGSPFKLCDSFDSYIKNATILSNDGLSMVEIFNDYFEPNAPFERKKEKKAEFPDAAIIMSIKRTVQYDKTAVFHVVSDDNGWHAALNDVENVVLHKDLKSILTLISKEEELFVQVVDFVKNSISQISESVKKWLFDQEWEFAIDKAETCIECDEIEDIIIQKVDIAPVGIDYIDHEEQYAISSLCGTAILEIHFTYIDHSEEKYDKEDHMWYNTKYGDGVLKIESPITLSQTIIIDDDIFDLDSPDIEDIDRDSVEILEYDLTENTETIYGPYFDTCPDCGERIGLFNDGGNGFCTNCAHKH